MFRLDIAEVKAWLRLDLDLEDEELNIVRLLMSSAESYLLTATGKEKFGDKTPIAKLVCQYLITQWYENRDFYNPTPNAVRNLALTAMITQLQFGGDNNELDTTKGTQSSEFIETSGNLEARSRR